MNSQGYPTGRSASRTRQGGATLIVSLIILLILTLLGVTAMQSATMEERMAGNINDRNLAFQAAESALRTGEAWLQSFGALLPIANDSASNGIYTVDTRPANWWDPAPTTPPQVADGTFSALKNQPIYVIEERAYVEGSSLRIGSDPEGGGFNVYRVSSRGTGGTDAATVSLESTYAVPE